MTKTPRVDLATTVHKGVRKLLFEQAMLFARCDFRDDSASRSACDALDACFVMLREHSEQEDLVIFPALAELDRDLACEAKRQHHALEQNMREIERTAATLRFATSLERPAFGIQLSQRFNQFVAAQLAHLAFEEVELQQVFWREKTDQELLAMRAAIRARLTPARSKVWLELMLASADPTELSALAPPTVPHVA